MKEAMFYKKLKKDNQVYCYLCAQNCVIKDGEKGLCGVRENKKGILYTLVYDKVISRSLDPIEKKPLFHFYPGTLSYSIATVGCNFRCLHCQNADIAQMPVDHERIIGDKITPEELVASALKHNAKSISYTYTEPTIFYELAYDTSKLAHQKGLKNTFITNGYMQEEPLRKISPYLDAANVDLKFFEDKLYKKVCAARLKPVLKTLKLMKELGIWLEVTTLIIPGLNDDKKQLEDIADFIVNELGIETPWHVSAFFPAYKMIDKRPTSAETIHKAQSIGKKKGLRYVYSGNIPHNEGESTYCYKCNEKIIDRTGYKVNEIHIKDGKCEKCGAPIDGEGLL